MATSSSSNTTAAAPSSSSSSSNKKWKSLFQLSSNGRRRKNSTDDDVIDNNDKDDEPNDELQDEDLFMTTTKNKCNSNRRPSAPAILVDLKNFLTKSVGRKSSSSYGLCSNSSRDNVNISSDPIHLVALKEQASPSIVEDNLLPLTQPPAIFETRPSPFDPPLLNKAGRKQWKKTFIEFNPSTLPNALQKSSSASNPNFVVNRNGDAKSSSSNNCQKLLLSQTKNYTSTASSVNQENSSEDLSHHQPLSDSSIIPAAVKSSTAAVAVGVQEQTRSTDISSSIPITAKPRLYQKRQRDIIQDDDSDEGGDEDLYCRRHTIADMTVAAYGMVICGTDDMHHRYRGRIEKVKFGVPINEAFVQDIPATLLVLLLKVNKEGPLKKDIWRAPGNHAQVRKLSHIMQHGRLVNISNISVYTAASVIKKFLSKLPGGIFGSENEQELFGIVQQPDNEQQRNVFCRVICSLSVPSQHLLVLLFGTFRIISDSADTFGTRMTPDAIGISVAPSLFHTCMHDAQRAKLEDVMRFKLASQVISKIIQGFGYTNLFPRECYEFYARITGRTLRVDEHWHFTFQYPSRTFSQPAIHRSCESPTDAATAATHSGNDLDEPGPSCYSRRRNTADVVTAGGGPSSSIPTTSNIEPLEKEFAGQRLSASMGEVLIHTGYESDVPERLLASQCSEAYESTRSLTYLEWVHEKQTKRMRTRSEWFLSPVMPNKNNGASKSVDFKQHQQQQQKSYDGGGNRNLLIPKSDDLGMSSTEDMQISPIPKTTSLPSSSEEEEEEESASGEATTPRQPLQEIQELTPTTSGGKGEIGSEATTPLAKNQAAIFFSQSQGGPILPAVVAVTPAPRVVSSSGVVRRKSWRTHYVRPNKSFDQESSGKNEELVESSSHSTPARRSSTGMPSFEIVVETTTTKAPETSTSSSAITATRSLIRRKSSGSNNGGGGKGKIPVQSRRSTQI